MKVTIITPAFNAEQYLKKTIESVLSQTFSDYEMIIIDDGSTDATKTIAQEYIKRYPQKIKYIYQDNHGLSHARNTGIKAAQGEYIALLDSDDEWFPNRLEESVKAMEADPLCGLVHSNIMRIDTSNEPLEIPVREKQYLSGMIFKELLLRKAHIACPTVLFRKSCLETIGLFDESLIKDQLGCEDRDLWLRLSRKFKICYIDQVLAYYRMSPGSMSRNRERMMKARSYVIEKNVKDLPNADVLKKQAYAVIYKDLADEFLLEGDYEKARANYGQSLKYWPFSFFSLFNYLKSLIRFKTS